MEEIINHYEIHGFEKLQLNDKIFLKKDIQVELGGLFASLDIEIEITDGNFKIQMCDCVVSCCGTEIYNGKPITVTKINKIIWKYISEYIVDTVGIPTVIEDKTKWGESDLI